MQILLRFWAQSACGYWVYTLSDMIDPRLFWLPVTEALLIGVLVGAQREQAKLSPNLGIREFVLCAAAGVGCGLGTNPALSAVALGALIVLLVAFRLRTPTEESGLTTDLSMLTVFCLSYVCALTDNEHARAAVVGVAVAITFLLESKDKVRKFFSETFTRVEFSGTLLFLALVFIIYPILPEGDFGPYDGFSPRDIWMFVILVSSVSFGGYFLEKHMGESSGLKVTAVLGGIASTTATTLSLAKEAKQSPEHINTYWQAATLANAIQFPRLFAFLSVISPPISRDAAFPLLAAGAAGILLAFLIPTKGELPAKTREAPKAESDQSTESNVELAPEAETIKSELPPEETPSTTGSTIGSANVPASSEMRNPLTLGPALKCGLVLAIVVFINKVVVATMGVDGLIWTSIVGGLVDVDAIAVSAADLFRDTRILSDRAVGSVLLAVCMNAVFKTGIAYSTGSSAFAAKVAISFSVMLAVAALVLHFM